MSVSGSSNDVKLQEAFAFVTTIRDPEVRSKKIIEIAEKVEGDFFNKVVKTIKELDALPVNGGYFMEDLQKVENARETGLMAIFTILMGRKKYDSAFCFAQESISSPLQRAKCLAQLAEATHEGPVFAQIVEAAKNLDAIAKKDGYLVRELQEVASARVLLKETLIAILMKRKEYEQVLYFIQQNISSPMQRAKYLAQLAKATREGPIFAEIEKAAKKLDAIAKKDGYLFCELQEVEPARALLQETLAEILLQKAFV